MKTLYIVTLAIFLAACSEQPVRCRGALQPINTPAAGHKDAQKEVSPPVGGQP